LPNNFPQVDFFLGYGGAFTNRTQLFLGGGHTTASSVNLYYDFDFLAGDIIHTAVTWDKSLGSSPVEVYFNNIKGTVVKNSPQNSQLAIDDIQTRILNPAFTYDLELLRRSKRPDGAQNQFDTGQYLDNLKIWDFAKTDFSDRFDESAGLPIPPQPTYS